jgi:mannan endo-1,4-beta-mannosidase
VSGREIRAPAGNSVLLRGVNKMSVFDDDDPQGTISFPEIAKTGANTVRIVWAIEDDQGKTDPNDLQALIDNAIAAGLLPMIELHDATGNWGRLDDLVAYWTRPQIVDIITARQNALLVNIGNEVGDFEIGAGQFRDGYRQAVQALRCAGIHTPLVIDAPDFGKNLDILNATAAALLEADPEHNLIFSVHLYWGIKDGADAQFIRDKLDEAVALSYPLIVGEFSVTGAVDPETFESTCLADGNVDYQTILQKSAALGIGWYAWEWGPGNSFGGPGCEVMDMTPDRLFANLKPGWATEVATTSPFSIKNTASPIL